MKITKSRLKQLIKEEIQALVEEKPMTVGQPKSTYAEDVMAAFKALKDAESVLRDRNDPRTEDMQVAIRSAAGVVAREVAQVQGERRTTYADPDQSPDLYQREQEFYPLGRVRDPDPRKELDPESRWDDVKLRKRKGPFGPEED